MSVFLTQAKGVQADRLKGFLTYFRFEVYFNLKTYIFKRKRAQNMVTLALLCKGILFLIFYQIIQQILSKIKNYAPIIFRDERL